MLDKLVTPRRPPMTRLLIVEDDHAVQDGAHLHFERYSDVTVVGQAYNVSEVRPLVHEHAPTMILMDLCLPERAGITARNQRHVCHGIRLIRQLRRELSQQNMLRIIAFTTSGLKYPEVVLNTVRAFVDGYIIKDECPSSDERIEIMRRVAVGEFVVVPTLAPMVAEAFPGLEHPCSYFRPLTDREEDVLCLLEEDFRAKEIAQRLGISVAVVNEYTENVKVKLHAKHKNQLSLGR